MFCLINAKGTVDTIIGNPLDHAEGLKPFFKAQGAHRVVALSEADKTALEKLITPEPIPATEADPNPKQPPHGSFELTKDGIAAKDPSGKVLATYPTIEIVLD